MAKWKALALERSIKTILCDGMFQNQGEELSMVLNEAQLSMVQLYYQKECEMVTKFIHAFERENNLKKHKQKRRRKMKIKCKKFLVHNSWSKLE
jgi:hypothetical protein